MKIKKKINPVMERAAKACGGQAEMARRLSERTGRDIKQQHIWNWINRGDVIPAEMAIPIEIVTNAKITRHQVRPDLYPVDDVIAKRTAEA